MGVSQSKRIIDAVFRKDPARRPSAKRALARLKTMHFSPTPPSQVITNHTFLRKEIVTHISDSSISRRWPNQDLDDILDLFQPSPAHPSQMSISLRPLADLMQLRWGELVDWTDANLERREVEATRYKELLISSDNAIRMLRSLKRPAFKGLANGIEEMDEWLERAHLGEHTIGFISPDGNWTRSTVSDDSE